MKVLGFVQWVNPIPQQPFVLRYSQTSVLEFVQHLYPIRGSMCAPLVGRRVNGCPAPRRLMDRQRISLCCSVSASSGIRREGDRRGGRIEIPMSPIVKSLTG